MSDIITKKLSALTPVTTMAATDYFPVNVDIGAGVIKTRSIQRDAIPFTTGVISYVDADGGSDSTGARGDFKKRFATPLAAANASSAGDLIVVFPGTYSVTANIARDQVNWHLMNGATLENNGTAAAMFDDSPSGLNADMRFYVTGWGNLNGTDNSGNSRVLFMGRSVSNVNIQCRSLFAEETSIMSIGGGTLTLKADSADMIDGDDSGEAFTISNGTVRIEIDNLVLEGGDAAVISGAANVEYVGRLVTATNNTTQNGFNNSSTGTVRITVTETLSVLNSAIVVSNGTTYVKVGAILSGQGVSGNGIQAGGSTSTLYVEADSITCSSSFNSAVLVTVGALFLKARSLVGAAVVVTHSSSTAGVMNVQSSTGRWNLTGTGRLRLIGVLGTGIDAVNNREPFNLGTSSNVTFQDCVGVGVGVASYSITASGSVTTPRIYNGYTCNLAPDPIITFAVGSSSIITDVDVV